MLFPYQTSSPYFYISIFQTLVHSKCHYPYHSPLNIPSITCSPINILHTFIRKQKTLWPLFMDAVQLAQGSRATPRQLFTCYYYSKEFLVLTWLTSNDQRPNRPWSHLVVLNKGPLDWESSTFTTKQLHLVISKCEWHKFTHFQKVII